MTAFVTSCSVARLESDLLRPKTRLWKTGSVDNDYGNAVRDSKAAAALGWTESRACVVDVSSHVSAQSANLVGLPLFCVVNSYVEVFRLDFLSLAFGGCSISYD